MNFTNAHSCQEAALETWKEVFAFKHFGLGLLLPCGNIQLKNVHASQSNCRNNLHETWVTVNVFFIHNNLSDKENSQARDCSAKIASTVLFSACSMVAEILTIAFPGSFTPRPGIRLWRNLWNTVLLTINRFSAYLRHLIFPGDDWTWFLIKWTWRVLTPQALGAIYLWIHDAFPWSFAAVWIINSTWNSPSQCGWR